MLDGKRAMIALGAACVVAGSFGPVTGQWRWDPDRGWTEPTPVAAIKEAAPPPFLPRYREEVEEAPVGTPAGGYNAAYLVYEADEFRTAAKMFRRLARAHENDPVWAARSLFMRGECFYQHGSYHQAYGAFDEMLTKYPGARHYRLALQREFEIAQQFLRGRRRRVLGLPLLPASRTAREILERIREQDPRGHLADDCLAGQADYYFRKGKVEDAEFHYELLLNEYPQSPFAPQALYRTACGRLFRQHGPDYDAGLLRLARSGFEQFLQRYPDAPEAGQAEFYLGRVETRLAAAHLTRGRFYQKKGQPVAALVYYRAIVREFPDTTAAAEAEGLIREIAPPELSVPPGNGTGPEPSTPGPRPEESANDDRPVPNSD